MIAACLCETQWEINSKHWKNCIAFMSSSVSCHAMITFKHLPSFIRVIATEGRIWLFPILKTFFLSVWGNIFESKIYFVYSNQIKFPDILFIIFYLCMWPFFLLVSSRNSTLGCQKLCLQKWKYPHYANFSSTDRHVLFYKLHLLVTSQIVFE